VPLVAGEDGERCLGDVGAGDLRGAEPVRIGCQAWSGIASIPVRTRLSCRAVTEKRTSNFAAVASTFLE
jgi:hypothetical protein